MEDPKPQRSLKNSQAIPKEIFSSKSSTSEEETVITVITRSGEKEPFNETKIRDVLLELVKIGGGLNDIDIDLIVSKVRGYCKNNIKTESIDTLCAETCAHLSTSNPDYMRLAGRLVCYESQRHCKQKFSDYVEHTKDNIDPDTKEHIKLWRKKYQKFVAKNKDKLDSFIKPLRDYDYDYFSVCVLCKAYLLKVNGRIAETIQYMWLRVAIQVGGRNLDRIKRTYDMLSSGYYTHATPTLFNSCLVNPQLSSCFLFFMKDDSIEGIYDTKKRLALLSKYAGGIGGNISNIREKGSPIRGTRGTSNGVTPMLKTFESDSLYVDQGGGKRPGSYKMYMEMWHPDFLEFINLKRNRGDPELRAPKLYYAIWACDLFFKRYAQGGNWSFFSPKVAIELIDLYGEEFEKRYEQLEKEGKAKKTIPAAEVMEAMYEVVSEVSVPSIVNKDIVNRTSNQNNIDTIKCSNLCTEVVQVTGKDEVSVCNLASICLPKYLTKTGFDYDLLYEHVCIITRNMNEIHEENYYPIEEAKKTNLRDRPFGLGVQGFADLLILMRLGWDEKKVSEINKKIFETIYYAAVRTSCDIATEIFYKTDKNGYYDTFLGSPLSKGKFNFEMHIEDDKYRERKFKEAGLHDLFKTYFVKDTTNILSGKWDWEKLRKDVMQFGVRNSLFLAPMPTASTSLIFGNTECIQPIDKVMYTRKFTAGEFPLFNKELSKILKEKGLWNEDMKKKIQEHNGSIQKIEEIPKDIREIFKTSKEVKQSRIITLAAERGYFVDQSQSMNLFVEKLTFRKYTSMVMYALVNGCKTFYYYLHNSPATEAYKVTAKKSLKITNSNNNSKKEEVDEVDEKRGEEEEETIENFPTPTELMEDNFGKSSRDCQYSCGA